MALMISTVSWAGGGQVGGVAMTCCVGVLVEDGGGAPRS
jgi:hypothetical protein